MKLKRIHLFTIAVFVVGLGLIYYFAAPAIYSLIVGEHADSRCPYFENDPHQYLFKICEYLYQHNIDVSPATPASYKILRTVEEVYDGKVIIRVFLSCCYLGDSVIIDKKSGGL